MRTLEEENLITLAIPTLLEEAGLNVLVKAEVGRTRDRDMLQLRLQGPRKKIFLDEHNGLNSIEQGGVKALLEVVVKTASVPGDLSAVDLLNDDRVRRASLSEVDIVDPSANPFLAQLANLPVSCIPVFYGSTSGINFAEVLETGICAQAIENRGVRAPVVFDYDGLKSATSNEIFALSMRALPLTLRERAINLSTSSEGLMGGRLAAVEEMLKLVDMGVSFNFVDGLEVFKNMVGEFNFSQGLLYVLARIAGQNPKLFGKSPQLEDLTPQNLRLDSQRIKAPVADLMKRRAPLGFAYYARDAVLASLGGVMGIPLKLTDKANIYKIMLPMNSLFDPGKGSGAVVLPITRQRIQFITENPFNVPVDPIALRVLAEEQAGGFRKLIEAFQLSCQVLTPGEAIAAGTADNRLLVEDYFCLKE